MMDVIKGRFAGTWIGDSRVEYENKVTKENNAPKHEDKITEEIIINCNVYNDYYSIPSYIKHAILEQFNLVYIAWSIRIRINKEKEEGIESVKRFDTGHSDNISYLENIRVCVKETYKVSSTKRTLINSEITKLIYTLNTTTRDIGWENNHGPDRFELITIEEINVVNETSTKRQEVRQF